MRWMKSEQIKEIVARLCIEANIRLREDILKALNFAYNQEKNLRAKRILEAIIENAKVSREKNLAICQDTGFPTVYMDIGQKIKIEGDLKRAVNKGVELGYREGFLRNSIVSDPLKRNKPGWKPAIIHIDLVRGDKIKITVLPKGFGCENKTRLKMFNPTASQREIKDFILETVKIAGPDACPPYVVGIGIGGTADYACLLAKKALLKKIKNHPDTEGVGTKIKTTNQNSKIYKLEKELLSEINKLNIGPMGLGGRTSALAVNIETYPTHIAGLPIAVNLSCHALRMATRVL
ncbi:MAG: fumarate hydratase [Candidatus Omnitrophica bacterium]|nr:fumarate hydratase [Candidatus Omnitrophota bacterium]